MSDKTRLTGARRRKTRLTTIILCAAGALVCVMMIASGALVLLGENASDSPAAIAGWVRFGLYVAVGLASGGLFVGLSLLLTILHELSDRSGRLERTLYELRESSQRWTDAGSSSRVSADMATEREIGDETLVSYSDSGREMVALLADIRDNMLLSPEQRAEKRQRVADVELEDATTKIRSLTKAGDFAQARVIAETIARKYANDPRAEKLPEEVETVRENQEQDDVHSCTRQVNDLMSISAWDRARELAQQLQQRHPDSAEARQLLLRIEKEHRLVEEEQRRRMNAEVQRFVTRRMWEEALVAARTFIERFPGCEESEALRMQLPMLETNAEIETRQQMEARIMDYARHGRYIEAVELAHVVIERFPGSPQAEALQDQIKRLSELAENPDAPPARVRID